jgi:hypothetical protein
MLVPPGKFWNSTSVTLRPLPSKSFEFTILSCTVQLLAVTKWTTRRDKGGVSVSKGNKEDKAKRGVPTSASGALPASAVVGTCDVGSLPNVSFTSRVACRFPPGGGSAC